MVVGTVSTTELVTIPVETVVVMGTISLHTADTGIVSSSLMFVCCVCVCACVRACVRACAYAYTYVHCMCIGAVLISHDGVF